MLKLFINIKKLKQSINLLKISIDKKIDVTYID